MTEFRITAVPSADHAAMAGQIEARLLDALAVANTQAVNTSVGLVATDPGGTLIGGVFGATSYGWLLVKLLWVDRDHRRTGIGRTLMTAIEAEGRAHGCHGAWLDTSNAVARAFYLAQGWSEFGVLENGPRQDPQDHRRWFLRKAL